MPKHKPMATPRVAVDFKPYVARMFVNLGVGIEELDADIGNCTYYLRAAPKPTNWMSPQPQYLHTLRQHAASILADATKIEAISAKDFNHAIRVLRGYMRKELALSKADRRRRGKEQRAQQLWRANKLGVTYTGAAEPKMLPDVLYKLDVWHKVGPKSQITLYAKTEKRDTSDQYNRCGEMRYSAHEIVAQGHMMLDGQDYEYADIVVSSHAFDHFPPG